MTETMALALSRRTDDELMTLADRLAKSTLLPKSMQGKVPDVLMTIMAGQEMGLAPMASLRAFHVIEGKPVMSADGMVALVLGSGKAAYFDCVEESDTSVTYETLRVGSKNPQRCTWTMEMAKKAALHQKDNWRCYARQMLGGRSKAELARKVYPDVLMGCYIEDEADHFDARPAARQPQRQPDVPDAEYAEQSSAPAEDHPEVTKIDTFETIESLKAHSAVIAKLPLSDADKRAANDRYKARMAWLKSPDRTQTAKPAEEVRELEDLQREQNENRQPPSGPEA